MVYSVVGYLWFGEMVAFLYNCIKYIVIIKVIVIYYFLCVCRWRDLWTALLGKGQYLLIFQVSRYCPLFFCTALWDWPPVAPPHGAHHSQCKVKATCFLCVYHSVCFPSQKALLSRLPPNMAVYLKRWFSLNIIDSELQLGAIIQLQRGGCSFWTGQIIYFTPASNIVSISQSASSKIFISLYFVCLRSWITNLA